MKVRNLTITAYKSRTTKLTKGSKYIYEYIINYTVSY